MDTYRITSDNFNGVYKTISYLLDKGHHHISVLSPENTNTAINDRTDGIERAFTDRGVSIDKGLWCYLPLEVLH
ncbi:type 1 periplasmic-binding domain-containing protein [Paenibacillus psychroresistens]|uniref:hypothetical protein n=1 Tax=Paenibacillus psychroresistens TaxID=1778678 RepID=UPI001D043B23|nr:hypothetical protein [Paenibacillus psychroresistens]